MAQIEYWTQTAPKYAIIYNVKGCVLKSGYIRGQYAINSKLPHPENSKHSVCFRLIFIPLMDPNWDKNTTTPVPQQSPKREWVTVHQRMGHVGPTAQFVQEDSVHCGRFRFSKGGHHCRVPVFSLVGELRASKSKTPREDQESLFLTLLSMYCC